MSLKLRINVYLHFHGSVQLHVLPVKGLGRGCVSKFSDRFQGMWPVETRVVWESLRVCGLVVGICPPFPCVVLVGLIPGGRLCLKCDGTRAETRFRLSAKRKIPFKSAGATVQSITGSRGVRISGNNAGYTMFRGSVKGTGYRIRWFPLYLPSHASPCAITFLLDSTV
jgi:hypothetical protein